MFQSNMDPEKPLGLVEKETSHFRMPILSCLLFGSVQPETRIIR